MSFLKTMINSIARTFGRILAYALIGLAIYFIASNFVSAKSYRIRAYNINDVELFNTTTNTSPSASGLMTSSYVNMNNGNMTANNTTYFSFDITYGVRTCMTQLGVNECLMTFNVGELYWVDSGGSVHQINDICNITATRTKTFETSQNTILWQFRVVGSCAFSPNATLTGFLLKSYYTYQNTSFTGTANKSAISLSNFDISQNPSEGQQIIDNANKNAQNIINAINNSNQEVINNQNENTQEIVDVGEDIVSSLNDTYNALTSDNVPSESTINSVFGDIGLTDETPMTNLLVFPLIIFSFFGNNMSASCSPVSLGTLFNHEIVLPCISLVNIFGVSLWNILDLLCMFYMLYNIVHLFIGIFEDISELRSPFLRFFIKNRGALTND